MSRHAEIAGAGIAGLGLASRLADAGWSVRVHEQSAEVRDAGAAIALGQNGVDALRKIGAFEGAIEGGTKLDYWSIEDQWNRIVHEDQVSTELYSVPRSSLLRSLYSRALDLGVDVRTGSAVSGYEDGALVLEDGARLSADLVVGADGAGSRTRETFAHHGVKVRQVDLKVAGLRAIMPRAAPDPRTKMLEWLSGSRRVGLLPLDEDQVYIYMFCRPDDLAGLRVPVDVTSWTASFPMLRSAFERVPADSPYRDILETHCETWVLDNAVLLGDAAFGMAPNLGQGACTGLQAAVSLSDMLADAGDIPAALRQWQREERPHVDYVQKWSGRYSRWCSKTPQPALRLRSLLFGAWSRSDRLNRRFAGVELRESPAR